jgi:hypothetical protein
MVRATARAAGLHGMWLKRLLWSAANVLAGVVLVLLALDPGRPLLPIFALLAVAVVLMLLPAWLPPGKRG